MYYSENFVTWLFRYLELDDVRKVQGQKQYALMMKLLDACNFCENEANQEEIKLVCDHVQKFGISSTKQKILQSEDIVNDLRRSLGLKPKKKVAKKGKSNSVETGGAAKTKKKATASTDGGSSISADQFSELLSAVDIYSRIYDYYVIREKYHHEFMAEVKKAMKRGWIPYGGVSYMSPGSSVVSTKVGNSFIQAMVKIRKVT